MWFFVLNLITLGAIVYLYVKKKYSYWSNLSVSGPKPSVFAFGNAFQISGSTDVPKTEVSLVQKYGLIYGTYAIFTPTLTVADPEAIKQILVKDFHLFVNRRKSDVLEELMNISLFSTENDNWKRIRGITSPAFTSGKLRSVQPIVQKSVDHLVAYLNRLVNNAPEKARCGLLENTKKVMAGFTIDTIVSAAFATETNANDDRSTENTLVRYATSLTEAGKFTVMCALLMPRWVNSILGVKNFLNETSFEYMRSVVEQMIKSRKGGQQQRSDLLQLLIDSEVGEAELKRASYYQLTADMDSNATLADEAGSKSVGRKNKLSDKEIVSQCMLFFAAGFGTTSDALTHLIFELSHDQAAQSRLIEELHQNLDGLDANSEEYFDQVMGSKLPYMNACISETLRKYPPLSRLERRCSQQGYKVAGIELQKNQLVEIPTYAIHYDPKYYPDPSSFKPDRFMPENKHLLVPYTYLPFGAGPRNCIGMRFAYQEMKMCIATVLRRYRFLPTDKTPFKLSFVPFKFGVETVPFEVLVQKQ